jgi:hypothetical protein
MHLTTLVSLLAVGAAAAPAAPAARSLDLNTRMVKPTLSNLGPLPEITNLVRRQDEEDPVEEEVPQTEDPEESSSSSSSSSSAAGLIPAIPTILRRQEPVATGEPSVDTGAVETKSDPLEAYLHTLDGEGDYDEDASDRALDRYHASLDKDESNSTTSAVTTSTSVAPATKTPVADTVNSTVPLDTKNVTSTDFDWKTLTGTADGPKKDVESSASTATNTTSIEQPAVKNVTDTAAPLTTATQDVESEKLADTTETPKNETSTEVVAQKNETTSALPEPTKKSDPLAMLSGLLPVKREEIDGFVNDLIEQSGETDDEDAGPVDLENVSKRQEVPELPEIPDLSDDAVPTSIDGVKSPVKRDEQPTLAPLPLLPPAPVFSEVPGSEELVKRQLESLTGAAPKEELPAPDVKEDDVTPTVDEKVIDSNSTAVNETATEASATPTLDSNATAVNETAAETSTTGSEGYAGINKHMDKLSKIPLGLPIKRQAPEFLKTPVAAPEIANPQPTGGLPTESEVDADSPLHKFLVPLQR